MALENSATKVLQVVKQDILAGVFAPGHKLKMSALKERYHVGVNPLREALSQLVVMQLVQVQDQRGYRVCPVSQSELIDIYDTRARIESLCVGLAIERGDQQWEADIVAAAYRLQANASLLQADGDLQSWEQLHQQFHYAIAKGCGSKELLRVRLDLYEKASRYRNLWLQHNAGHAAFDVNQKEHEQLVCAVLERDIKAAQSLISKHILVPSHVLQDLL
ncbi:MAG: DNA-binding transcriptional regulator CsiR [Gammaproteobacteria bacterium]|nr:DNA-binding transcriptional regulator CsiR [Gammaproteobacteria bacterium]